ncbi:MAG: neutral/alkaline non-lysosomal ceramidase N-terminal domain-containing protein, partial [Clostridia bacterium]|nr:neutral/alkaline non-lysosomal ceramidase N-terminal domain-containing protein [Clostridia bacterium]
MKCGFFEMDITPPFGSIIPGGFGARLADEVIDPLYVRAVAMQAEGDSAAIAVIDACGITMELTERIVARVTSLLPLKPESVMIMATHTHTGGPTLNWGEEVKIDPVYIDFLVSKTSDAIVSAWNSAKESELYFGKEQLHDVSFIRVYKMKDGSLLTNPGPKRADLIDAPYTTIDPDVFVLSVKQDNRFVGAIVNFACHPAIVSIKHNKSISGDFISVLSNELKQLYGPDFVTLFVNGACGNINHLNPFDEETRKDERERVIGQKLAQAASSAMSDAKILKGEISAVSKTIEVGLRKPTEEQLIKAKRLFDSLGDDLIHFNPRTSNNYIEFFFALQAFQIQADKRTKRPVYLQVIRIGSVTIVGIPCQMFTEYGKRIKASLPEHVMVSIFASDYCGYVPVPECMKEGVYETRLATSSALVPEAGDIITNEAIALAKELNA